MIDSEPEYQDMFRKALSEIKGRSANDVSGGRLAELLYMSLPEGVGKAYIPVDGYSLDEALEVDFRTAWAMVRGKNRLDRPSGNKST